MNSNDPEEVKFEQFWNGIAIMIGASSVILSLSNALLSFSNPYLTIFSVICSAISITVTTFLILAYASQIGWMTECFSFGLATGTLIMIALIAIFRISGNNLTQIVKDSILMFTVYYTLISIYNNIFKTITLIDLNKPSLLVVIIGLIFFIFSLRKVDQPIRSSYSLVIIGFLLIILYHFAMLPIWMELESY